MRLPLTALTALAVVLLAWGLVRPAAGDEAPAIDLAPEDLALLPITDIQRDYLIRDHPALVTRLTVLSQRAENMRKNLARRKDAGDSAGLALATQIEELRGSLRPVLEALAPILVAHGVPPDAFARARAAPRGPLREERYAHALVLEAPGVDPAARAVLRRLVPAIDGALLLLRTREQRAERAGSGEERTRIAEEARTEAASLEKRFWRTVDVLLDAPARRWIRMRLPTKQAEYADLLGHLFRLPGLTASQGTRLKALLVELDAEASAETAEVKRADARLAEGGVTDAERLDLERAKQAAFRRATELKIAAFERGMKVLTPEQAADLQSIPPHVTAEERLENPRTIVEKIDLSVAQGLALAEMARTYEDDKRQVEAEVARVGRRLEDQGADSPRQDEMMMAYAAIQGRVQAVVREATREIFLSILTPDQVVAWVIGVER